MAARHGGHRLRLTFKVAATYMGTVVGAGFASGQESLQFFTAYGRYGFWGLGLATVLFCAYGMTVLELGRRLGARSQREVLVHACGPVVGRIIDLVVAGFLLAALTVMLAGAGALVSEQFGWPRAVGTWITLTLTGLTVLGGLSGIVAANAVVVPLLATTVLSLCLLSINHHGGLALQPAPVPGAGAAPHWLLAAWLYVAYNLTLAVAVLAPLGGEIDDRRVLRLGGLLGGLGLGLMALAIQIALASHMPEISRFQVPLLHIARFYSVPIQVGFALVLWAEIYTTAIAGAYGFTQRLAEATGLPYAVLALPVLGVAALGSQAGFTPLVASLYPALGYAGLSFLTLLAYHALCRAPHIGTQTK